jgi:hypothetical protein
MIKNISRFDLGMIIAFVVVGLLGGGAWWYLSGELATVQDDVNTAKQTFDQYSTKQVYLPTQPNQKILQDNIDMLKAQLDPLVQTRLMPPNGKLATIEKEDALPWKHDLDAEVLRLTTDAKTHGVGIPEKFYFGFSRYLGQNPAEDTTIVLSKQLIAIDQIADIFINAPVKSIRFIHRTYEEESSPVTSEDSLPGHAVNAEGGVYTAYPFEIEFEATTDSFRKVINDLMQAPYVFVVRSLTIQNSRLTSPQLTDLEALAGGPGPSVLGSSPGEVAETKSTLGPQFLFGAEVLHIRMRIDMIEWKGTAGGN